MVGVRKHIHRLYSNNAIHIAHQCKVTRLGCRVATYIDNTLGSCIENHINNRLIHSCARWVEDNNVGTAVLGNKIVA